MLLSSSIVPKPSPAYRFVRRPSTWKPIHLPLPITATAKPQWWKLQVSNSI